MLGLGLGIRKRRVVASSPPSLAAGIAYDAGNLAVGNLTLTGNATNGTGPYSYAWTLAGPDLSAVSWPSGWESLANQIVFDGAAASGNMGAEWTGNGTATASGSEPGSIEMSVGIPDAGLSFAVLHGGYLATLTVTDALSATAVANLSICNANSPPVANYTLGGSITGNVTFTVSVVNETEGGDGEIQIEEVVCPANCTHWCVTKVGADGSFVVQVHESNVDGASFESQSAQDYLLVIYGFNFSFNSGVSIGGPYTVAPPE